MEAQNGGGTPVILNVYDLTPINNYLYWFGLGVFHSGIEVHGLEYGFGAHDLPVSGVFEVEPKSCPGYVYRRSIWMGTTAMSRAEFRSFVQTLAGEYSGNTYHLISKNCNHFTDDVCKNITKKSAPGWVNRLARVGSFFNRLLPKSVQVSTVSHRATYPAFSVHGLEYGFGAHDLPVSGVFEVEPKSCPGYVYRRSIWMGTTAMSRAEFRSFVQTLAGEYSGNTYHLISKNCNHLTDDVCKNITKKSAPGWVNRLARVGSFFNRLLPKNIQVSTVSHGATYPAFSDDDMDSVSSSIIGDSDVDELDQHLLLPAVVDLHSIDVSSRMSKDLP